MCVFVLYISAWCEVIFLEKDDHGDEQDWSKAADDFLFTLSVNVNIFWITVHIFACNIAIYISLQVILEISEESELFCYFKMKLDVCRCCCFLIYDFMYYSQTFYDTFTSYTTKVHIC